MAGATLPADDGDASFEDGPPGNVREDHRLPLRLTRSAGLPRFDPATNPLEEVLRRLLVFLAVGQVERDQQIAKTPLFAQSTLHGPLPCRE